MAIGLPGILTLYIANGWSAEVQRDTLFGAIALSTNLLFFILSRPRRGGLYYRLIPLALLTLDILFVTYLIFSKGGIESRSVILYAVPILMSAALFGRKAVYMTAFAAAFSYDALMYADYIGRLDSIGNRLPDLHSSTAYVLNTIVFFTALLIIIATTVDFLVRLLVRQEQVANHSLDALKNAQAIAKLGNWEWDVRSDTYTWSEQFNKIFGISNSREAKINRVLKNLHPRDRAWIQRDVINPIKSFRPVTADRTLHLIDGSTRYVHIESRPVRDRYGNVSLMIGTIQDLTDQMILDNAKNDFVSLASHQLRTPATGVKQYIGMLLDNYAGEMTDMQRQLLKTAYESNERQLLIIDDLLHVAQVDSGKSILRPERVDLNRLARDVVKDMRPNFTKSDQTIRLKTTRKPATATVDKNQLRMVLENLIDNAHKYSLANATTTVSITPKARTIEIAIQDTGVGIAPQDIPMLFKKFSRIDNPVSTLVGGTGLGLYWASRIIDMHNGTIGVDSTLNGGTTFTITIPTKLPKLN